MRVKQKTGGETMMWKEVPYSGDQPKERACRKQLVLEVHILRNFSHPNIVGFRGCALAALHTPALISWLRVAAS